MSMNLNLSLTKLRDLAKAHDRLSRGATDIKSAEAASDKILDEFLQILDNAEISEVLNNLMAEARIKSKETPAVLKTEMKNRREELIPVETKLMRSTGARKRDIENLFNLYQMVKEDQMEYISDFKSLMQTLSDLHNSAKKKLSKARSYSRKKKKKCKKKLGQGIVSAIFGTGAIIADVLLPVVFQFSYGLGGSAIYQALRDIAEAATD